MDLELLRVGRSPSLDIPSALQRLPHGSRPKWYVLVSMIDSTPDVARLPSLVPLLKRLAAWYITVDDDVVLELPTLMMLIEEHDFLSGFDEIWLCTDMPRSGKPEHVRITSDQPLGPEQPSGLAEWMLGSFCRAGLGDGDGLNYVTCDPELAVLWSGHASVSGAD